MKKKLFALMLTAAMVLGMSTNSMAAETDYEASEATSFHIKKAYTTNETFAPGETLHFSVTNDPSNPSDTSITVGDNNSYTIVPEDGTLTYNIPVNVPSYTTAGTYLYTITELAGNAAGVTYDATPTIDVAVYVGYDNTADKLVILNTSSYIVKNSNSQKVTTFTNSFNTGDFTVAKNVTGNMANENDAFEIKVTFTSDKPVFSPIQVAGETVGVDAWTQTSIDGVDTYTYESSLSYTESSGAKTFANIPVGVNVTVEEMDKNSNGYKYLHGESSFTVKESNAAVIITNERSAAINTGVSLDNVPYLLALAALSFTTIALLKKKRKY